MHPDPREAGPKSAATAAPCPAPTSKSARPPGASTAASPAAMRR